MIRPREVFYPPLNRLIRIPSPFSAKLEDAPVVGMARRDERDEPGERIPVRTAWVCYCGSGCYDDCDEYQFAEAVGSGRWTGEVRSTHCRLQRSRGQVLHLHGVLAGPQRAGEGGTPIRLADS